MKNELALLPKTEDFSMYMQIADMGIKSGLLPAAIKTKEAAMIIALKGRELGLPPMVAFSHINVIQGKPTMSAEIMLAYIYRDYPTAEIVIVEKGPSKCVIKAKRPSEKEFSTFTWDMERAKKMGLAVKDNWQKQPETMLFWRSITEMKRAKFPEVLMGIDYAPEELGAEVDSTGSLKDVGPALPQAPTTATIATKSIVNHAPQTPEEAEKRNKEIEAKKADEDAKKAKENSQQTERDQLVQSVLAEKARLKMENPELVAFISKSFNKKTDELSNEELGSLWASLKELAEKPS